MSTYGISELCPNGNVWYVMDMYGMSTIVS